MLWVDGERGYLAAVTFDELLAGMPQQDQTTWAHQAAREWRGREPSDFDVVIGEGIRVPPYVATGGPGFASTVAGSDQGSTWTQLSDLRSLGRSLTVAELMNELEGGAQGIVVDAAQLRPLAGAGSRVRFDFLELVVTDPGPETWRDLEQILPSEQRAQAKISLWVREGGAVPSVFRDANHVRDAWPRLGVGVCITPRASSRTSAAAALSVMRELHGLSVSSGSARGIDLSLCVSVPSDYLRALAWVEAVDLLWRDVAGSARDNDTALPLRVYAGIECTAETPTPEAYLIDATTRAVAAVSAGVAGLVVTPYSAHVDHRRQVRNLQHVLALEANLGGHGDAIAGARLIEAAAYALAEAAQEDAAAATAAASGRTPNT